MSGNGAQTAPQERRIGHELALRAFVTNPRF